MSKRILLLTAFLLAVGLLAAGVVVYQRYLAPNQLIPVVRQALEAALGQPVDLEDARIVGIGMLSFGKIRIPSSSETSGVEPWLTAESATLHLGLTKLIATGNLSLDINLEKPVFTLRNDPTSGWNFLSRGDVSPRSADRSESGRKKRSGESGKSVDLRLQMETPVIWVRDQERGECRIPFSEVAVLEFRSNQNSESKSLRINGKGLIHARLEPTTIDALPLALRDLVTVVGFAPEFEIGIEGSLHGEGWEIASRQNPGIVLDSTESDLLLSRFRFAGRKEVDGKFSFETAAIESATIQSSSWNHPAIERLKVPWTEPPQGSLTLGIHDFQFGSDKVQCSLSGIHIEETTLSIEALPWLKVLTPKQGWKLSDVDLSGALTYSIPDGAIRWDSGKIVFQSGQGGRIETSGSYEREPQTEWSVAATVHDFPVPQAMTGKVEVAPGILSGEMKWVETVPPRSDPLFLAEGTVRLQDGEIGAIRLFGGLDDLLEDEGILSSPFSRFSFNFDLKEDRIGISDLRLESEILDLAGTGSYGPGRKLELDLEIRPTMKLAETLRDATSSLLASGVAESKDPLKVRATGTLENPAYSITFGEGMKIPIKGLDVQF